MNSCISPEIVSSKEAKSWTNDSEDAFASASVWQPDCADSEERDVADSLDAAVELMAWMSIQAHAEFLSADTSGQ